MTTYNIYDCSEADLATIPKIGAKTAKAIKDLVQEVKKEAPLTVSDLAAVKYSEEFWTELLDKGTLSIDYTPASWDGTEKGHEVKYVTEETFEGAMSYIAEQIEKKMLKGYILLPSPQYPYMHQGLHGHLIWQVPLIRQLSPKRKRQMLWKN